MPFVYPIQWNCAQSDASSTLCNVTATTTDASSSASTLALHGELGTIIFGEAVLILLGTLLMVGMLWNAMKFNKRS